MKKFLIWLTAWILSLWLFAFASSSSNYPDSFQVEVNPSNFQVNQAVDVTVTALKNGQIMTNYDWDFSISVEQDWVLLQSHEATVPEGGWGTIRLEDQGVVTYTQGLLLKKSGTFQVKVSEFTDETISWSASITVAADVAVSIWNIDIFSPAQNWTTDESPVTIMANAPSYPNARVDIYLNNMMVKSWMTDGNWFLSESVQLEQKGTNTLELKAVNINGDVVAQSPLHSFLYDPIGGDLIKQTVMSPNENLKIGDKVRFDITTDDRVSSVKLLLSWDKENINEHEYLMDKEGDGLFSKEFSLPSTWDFVVNLEVTAALQPQLYTGQLYFSVSPNVEIVNLKIVADTGTNGLLHLSWDTDGGDSSDYVVIYWEKWVWSEDDDPWREFSTEKEYDVTLAPWRTYEFRVYATDADHFQEGIPSVVTEFEYKGITWVLPQEVAYSWENSMCWENGEHCIAAAPTCIVSSIKFSTEQIGNKYYLVWSEVENATKYLVYKSDFADWSNKQFVGETELTRFEYPFDNKAKEETYAYYTIEAICSDWAQVVVTEVNKVQVGPFEDMMLILVATVLLYLMYRVYTYRV